MHPSAFDFVRRTVQSLPPLYRVVEFGSHSWNGSVREIFTDATNQGMYLGIDLKEGPGVDLVADVTTWEGLMFDCVVCCEVLEHCQYVVNLLQSARRALRPGGYLIVTCASLNRAEHSSDGDAVLKEGEWYLGRDADEVTTFLLSVGFSAALTDLNAPPEDTYILGLVAR
jgi:SAM-dependent methyltransferase